MTLPRRFSSNQFLANLIGYADRRAERAAQRLRDKEIDPELDAELVIADMSLQNANAFYEMGLRHMERKPIIHMFRAGEAIPFDVKP